MRRIADFASLYQVRTGSHGLPICHQSAWLRRCTLICGSPFRCPGIHGLFRTNARSLPAHWTFDNGYMHPGDKPGLGIESMKSWRRNIPMNLLICQSHVGRWHAVELVRSKIMKSILIENRINWQLSNAKYLPRQRVKTSKSETCRNLWFR